MKRDERMKYTFFALIGDIGGFQSALVFLPAQIMSIYASRMLTKSMAEDLPVRLQSNAKHDNKNER